MLLSQLALKNFKKRKCATSPFRMAGFYNFFLMTGIIDPQLIDETVHSLSYNEREENIVRRIVEFLKGLILGEG